MLGILEGVKSYDAHWRANGIMFSESPLTYSRDDSAVWRGAEKALIKTLDDVAGKDFAQSNNIFQSRTGLYTSEMPIAQLPGLKYALFMDLGVKEQGHPTFSRIYSVVKGIQSVPSEELADLIICAEKASSNVMCDAYDNYVETRQLKELRGIFFSYQMIGAQLPDWHPLNQMLTGDIKSDSYSQSVWKDMEVLHGHMDRSLNIQKRRGKAADKGWLELFTANDTTGMHAFTAFSNFDSMDLVSRIMQIRLKELLIRNTFGDIPFIMF
jgi:hypothetical protein